LDEELLFEVEGNSKKKYRAYGLNKQPAIDAIEVPAEDVQLEGCSSKKKTIPITKPITMK
jgi:hypothetical protein